MVKVNNLYFLERLGTQDLKILLLQQSLSSWVSKEIVVQFLTICFYLKHAKLASSYDNHRPLLAFSCYYTVPQKTKFRLTAGSDC